MVQNNVTCRSTTIIKKLNKINKSTTIIKKLKEKEHEKKNIEN